MELAGTGDRPQRLRVGLGLPKALMPVCDAQRVEVPAHPARLRLDWNCVPLERGTHPLPPCHLEFASPLGFWEVRRWAELKGEVRVYPNLQSDRKQVAAMFLRRGGVGMQVRRQVGKGREFEKLRDYLPGDSAEDIHWKATAKRGRPVTKVFRIERTQEVYVLLDASRLSARIVGRSARAGEASGEVEEGNIPGRGATVLERHLTAALMLGMAAEQQGDHFGLVTFSDQVRHFLRARRGRAHHGACREAIYALQPRLVAPDFDEVCSYLRTRLRRRALLVILTALDDPVLAESFVRNVSLLSRQHLVLTGMIRPPGVGPIFAGAEAESVEDIYGRLSGHLRWHDLQELQRVLKHRGVTFSLLENERMTAELVSQYLEVKQRQLL
jgi:uncharacterized protein (DUF58 family)